MLDILDHFGLRPTSDQFAGLATLVESVPHFLDPIRDHSGLDICQHSRLIMRVGIQSRDKAAKALIPDIFPDGIFAAYGKLLRFKLKSRMRAPLRAFHLDINPGALFALAAPHVLGRVVVDSVAMRPGMNGRIAVVDHFANLPDQLAGDGWLLSLTESSPV
jgi:hypothetical protein